MTPALLFGLADRGMRGPPNKNPITGNHPESRTISDMEVMRNAPQHDAAMAALSA